MQQAKVLLTHTIKPMLAALALVVALPAVPHHSTAMFDFTKTVELTGTVKSFQWTNPHTWTVFTVEGKGKIAGEYGLEGMSPNYLSRNGWTKRSLNPGDKVKLMVYPLKDGRKGGFMVSATLANGKVVYNLPRRPERPAVGQSAAQTAASEAAAAARAAASN